MIGFFDANIDIAVVKMISTKGQPHTGGAGNGRPAKEQVSVYFFVDAGEENIARAQSKPLGRRVSVCANADVAIDQQVLDRQVVADLASRILADRIVHRTEAVLGSGDLRERYGIRWNLIDRVNLRSSTTRV